MMVSSILNSTDATASTTVDGNHHPPTVKIVNLPKTYSLTELKALGDLCASHVSNGYTVAVVGSTDFGNVQWSRDDISMLLGGRVGSLGQTMNCQSNILFLNLYYCS